MGLSTAVGEGMARYQRPDEACISEYLESSLHPLQHPVSGIHLSPGARCMSWAQKHPLSANTRLTSVRSLGHLVTVHGVL